MKNCVLTLCMIFLLQSCIETEFKPVEKNSTTSGSNSQMQVEFSSKLVATGLNISPYKVVLSVKTQQDYGLFLAKSTDPQAFYGLNGIDPNSPPATIIPLAAVSSTDFTYEDTSPTNGSSYYYAVLKKIDSTITTGSSGSNTTSSLPSSIQITIPEAIDLFNLNVETTTATGQKPSVRINYSKRTYDMYLGIFVNNVLTNEILLPANSYYYNVSNLDYQKDYKFKVIKKDNGVEVDSSTSAIINFSWPVADFNSEITSKVTALANYSEYNIEVSNTSANKYIYKVYLSTDNVNFNLVQTVLDSDVTRTYTDFNNLPVTKYVKIIQYDRNNNVLATSSTFIMNVPQDLSLPTGQILNGSSYAVGGIITYGRLKLDSSTLDLTDQNYIINVNTLELNNANIYYGIRNLTINSKILNSTNSSITAFNSVANHGVAALNSGIMKINTEEAYGEINLNSKGQTGYTGNGGTSYYGTTTKPPNVYYGNTTCGCCGCTWTNFPALAGDTSIYSFPIPPPAYRKVAGSTGYSGGAGENGGNGGNSGKIQYWVSKTDSIILNITRAGGAGGTGGAGGIGSRGACIKSGGYDPYPYDVGDSCIMQGDVGATGSNGSNGSTGSVGQYCRKLVGQSTETCY